MTLTNTLATLQTNPTALGKRMLIGGVIALIVISVFIFPVNHPHPSWGQFWMVRPLIITPLAGAAGGAFFYILGLLLGQDGWKKALAIGLGVLGYMIALWMGIILGLSGTLWH